MDRIVAWLNENQGFALAALTVVYAIATVVLALLAWHANRLSSRALRQAEKSEQRRMRPLVFFDFEEDGDDVYAVVRNIGRRSALNVSVTVHPEPHKKDRSGNSIPLAMLSDTIRLLAPDADLSECVDFREPFFHRYGSAIFEATLSYNDPEEKDYTETFKVTISGSERLVHVPKADVASELRQIRWALQGMRSRSG